MKNIIKITTILIFLSSCDHFTLVEIVNNSNKPICCCRGPLSKEFNITTALKRHYNGANLFDLIEIKSAINSSVPSFFPSMKDSAIYGLYVIVIDKDTIDFYKDKLDKLDSFKSYKVLFFSETDLEKNNMHAVITDELLNNENSKK